MSTADGDSSPRYSLHSSLSHLSFRFHFPLRSSQWFLFVRFVEDSYRQKVTCVRRGNHVLKLSLFVQKRTRVHLAVCLHYVCVGYCCYALGVSAPVSFVIEDSMVAEVEIGSKVRFENE